MRDAHLDDETVKKHEEVTTIKVKGGKKKSNGDGGGVGGRGVHLSPWIHQEYNFRHGSACRIPGESRQEYMTTEKKPGGGSSRYGREGLPLEQATWRSYWGGCNVPSLGLQEHWGYLPY